METLDLLIRSARLRDGSIRDIGILAGRIHLIETILPHPAGRTIEAGGMLVTESFCNPHLHLDKVFTLARLDDAAMQAYHGEGMGKAMAAIETAARVKEDYRAEWAIENIRQALEMAVRHGNTHIRAFADVDSKARLEGVRALLQAKQEFAGRLALQIVAFPQDGVVREPGTAGLVREAMALGADLVGGIPWIEFTDRDAQTHVDEMFDIAREFDAGVSMLVDDAGDPGLRTTEMMAVKAIEIGWQGRVLGHHARAMALYPKPYFQRLAALLKQARMGIITDPHTGPLHARVRELLEEGCLVALGQDDVSDAYYPYGRNNMLEIAFLASHLLWMTSRQDMEILYDMVTVEAARAMGIDGHRLEPGRPANLVVLDVPDSLEALRHHGAPAAVVFNGRLVSGGD
ncbi:MAG TPA: amidohydrolase family protein [Anaerolineales bacterium]|nr:amidohydrolase family protein [Anaerolineales bacterium]